MDTYWQDNEACRSMESDIPRLRRDETIADGSVTNHVNTIGDSGCRNCSLNPTIPVRTNVGVDGGELREEPKYPISIAVLYMPGCRSRWKASMYCRNSNTKQHEACRISSRGHDGPFNIALFSDCVTEGTCPKLSHNLLRQQNWSRSGACTAFREALERLHWKPWGLEACQSIFLDILDMENSLLLP